MLECSNLFKLSSKNTLQKNYICDNIIKKGVEVCSFLKRTDKMSKRLTGLNSLVKWEIKVRFLSTQLKINKMNKRFKLEIAIFLHEYSKNKFPFNEKTDCKEKYIETIQEKIQEKIINKI